MSDKNHKNPSAHSGQEDKEAEETTNNVEKQRDEYLAGWQRAKADLSNYKKDEFKRLEEIARFANAEMIMDLIRVMDSFELSLTAMEKTGGAEKGIYLIKSQLGDVLRKYGLEPIETETDQEFDPHLHEAVVSVGGTVEQDGKIMEEIEKGYVLNGRVIRASKVKVYKSKK
ncbi:nucleotide exchange factor GrpE [Patescibacteria group bacterium]|nr:nucleotide exchange factor GrpE [Patescibacteria group bacterium]